MAWIESLIRRTGEDVGIYRETVGGEGTAILGGADNAFDTTLTEADDYWVGMTLRFTAGTLAGERKVITAYIRANGKITVGAAFSDAPGNDTFVIEGSYGDPASTWALKATEMILITRPKASSYDSIAGRIDQSEYVGYLLSNSVAKSHDYLLLDSVKYDVVNVDNSKKRGTTFGRVAQLKKMTEGT